MHRPEPSGAGATWLRERAGPWGSRILQTSPVPRDPTRAAAVSASAGAG
jgi:hypothetical protein